MALVKVDSTQKINNVRARQVDKRSQADLLIFVTDSRGVSQTKESIWTYVESEGEANLRIFWGKAGVKGLRICFVDDAAVAGWVNKSHPLFGKLI